MQCIRLRALRIQPGRFAGPGPSGSMAEAASCLTAKTTFLLSRPIESWIN